MSNSAHEPRSQVIKDHERDAEPAARERGCAAKRKADALEDEADALVPMSDGKGTGFVPQSGMGAERSVLLPAQVPNDGVNIYELVRALEWPVNGGERPRPDTADAYVTWPLFLKGNDVHYDGQIEDWVKRHFALAMRRAFEQNQYDNWEGRISVIMGVVDQPMTGFGPYLPEVVSIKCTLCLMRSDVGPFLTWAMGLPPGVWLQLFSIRNAMGTLPRRLPPETNPKRTGVFPPVPMSRAEYDTWGDWCLV